MSQVPVRPLSALLAAVFLMMAGAGTLTTVLSVRLAGASTPPLLLGAVMAAYFAGLTLGSVAAYRAIRRVGHIRAFATFLSLLSAATLGHALSHDLWAWGVLRAIEGYCMAALLICVESWLNQKATPVNRGKILAFYMTCLYGGYGVGQLLLSLEGAQGFAMLALISVLLSLALIPVTLTRQTPPELPDVASFGLGRLYRTSQLGTVGAVISGVISGTLYALGPVYMMRLGYGTRETGLFMSAAILGGVLLQWPLGWLSDLFDRRLVLVGLFGALAVTSLGMAFASAASLSVLLVGAALFGGMTFVVYPVCVAQTNDRLPQDDMVGASGGLVLLYSLGATAGPFGASAALGALGAPGMMAFSALAAALAVGFGVWSMRTRPPVPADEQTSFAPIPRTTPVVGALAPGGDVPPGGNRPPDGAAEPAAE